MRFPLALLFFNVGVEIGQLLFIAAVLAVIAGVRRLRLPQPAWAAQLPVYAIGTVAAYWTIERVVGLSSVDTLATDPPFSPATEDPQ